MPAISYAALVLSISGKLSNHQKGHLLLLVVAASVGISRICLMTTAQREAAATVAATAMLAHFQTTRGGRMAAECAEEPELVGGWLGIAGDKIKDTDDSEFAKVRNGTTDVMCMELHYIHAEPL